jgi:hypothetical protein
MHRLALALAALVALAGPRPAQAFCASPPMTAPLVITSQPIAPDGGIVVLLEGKAVDVPADPHRVKLDGVEAAPDIVALAPGLVLYRVKSGTKQTEVLEGKTVVATIKTDVQTPRLAAPRVKRIASKSDFGGRKTKQRSVVTLRSAAPAGAIALVVTDASDGRALTFGFVGKDATEVTVFHHFGCGTLPEGMGMPMIRSKVKLHWIDASGRASAASPALVVGELT